MLYLEKNIEEKKMAQKEALRKYIEMKDRELAMLYMDDEEIARAQKTGEYNFKAPDDQSGESPGLRDFKMKRL
jgi:hypothetical protein